jgi:hypothetical protein
MFWFNQITNQYCLVASQFVVGTLDEATKEAKMISISEDYLAFLHDELAENQIRLREILGDSQAQAMFCWSADRLISTAESGRYATDPLEGVIKRLAGWGMEVSRKDKGTTIELAVKCPYAEKVHPRISSKEPKCPLGEYVLGAVRLEESKSHLLRNDLAEDGVIFKIQRS